MTQEAGHGMNHFDHPIMIQPKKILFLTTHNLATNPRLVKEVDLALSKNHKVELVCFEFNNWSFDLNQELKTRFSDVKIHTISAGRNPIIPWLRNIVTEKANRLLGKIFSLGLAPLSQSVSRRSNMLIAELNNIEGADLVVGHNPGALYPTLVASQKFNCAMGFDVEDYHAGEGNNKYLQSLTRSLMVRLLPQMNYVSFASPHIMEHVKQDSNVVGGNWFSVLNYFPAEEFSEPNSPNDGPVKMVWFSQNISSGRGLELILPRVKKLKSTIELHLIGNLDTNFYESDLKDISNIVIHPPMKQKDLHQELSCYDIGLALDIPVDINRDIVITNKLMAYLQSGIYVCATNTNAQQSLLIEFPAHGVCFDYKANNVAAVLEKVIDQINIIREQRTVRYKNFQPRNWEAASLPLLNAWNKDFLQKTK